MARMDATGRDSQSEKGVRKQSPLSHSPFASQKSIGASRFTGDYWRTKLFRPVYGRGKRQHEVQEWNLQVQREGRRGKVGLGTNNKEEACRRVAQFFKNLVGKGWDVALSKLNPDKEIKPKVMIIAGDLINTVRPLPLRLLHKSDSCIQWENTMCELQQKRRAFLLCLAGLGCGRTMLHGQSVTQAATPQGYVLRPGDGEHLVHFRNPGNIFIKVDPTKAARNLALGTQQVPVGAGIPVHRHFQMDEAFYVLEGGGNLMLNDVPHSFEKGGTIFIPKNTWHGFSNPDQELLLLWIVAPAGLEGFFRDTCNPPGVPPRQLTKEQINDIARKYGTEFR